MLTSSLSSGRAGSIFTAISEVSTKLAKSKSFKEARLLNHNPLLDESTLWCKICEHPLFEPTCLAVIVGNALWIGIAVDQQDPDGAKPPSGFKIVEYTFCAIFTIEIIVRVLAYRHRRDFFRDGQKWLWNVFDLVLVLLLIFETWVLLIVYGDGDEPDLPALSSLRLLRLLRIVRVLRMVPELAMMVRSLVAALRSVTMTFVLAVGIMYVFSILMTQWARDHKQKTPCEVPVNCVDQAFGTISRSFMTLMQILCFDATFSLIRAILGESAVYGLLLIVYILIAAFTVLNMLIGVVCEIVSSTNNEEREKMMREKLRILFNHLDSDGSGCISRAELQHANCALELEKAGVDGGVIRNTLEIIDCKYCFDRADRDKDGQLDLEEFLDTVFKLLHPPESQDILLIQRKLDKLEKVIVGSGMATRTAPVGPLGSREVHVKVDELERQVTALMHQVSQEGAAPSFSSAPPAAAEAVAELPRPREEDVELRHLDAAMWRLRARLERCCQEPLSPAPGPGQAAPEDLKRWRRLCAEVVEGLSVASSLVVEAVADGGHEPPRRP